MMGNQAALFYILVLILETTQNLLQPEYSVQMASTERIIFSLGDVDLDDDNDDELEVIKNQPQNPKMDGKLDVFHKFVEAIKVTEKPLIRFFYMGENMNMFPSKLDIEYPDSPIEVARDSTHLSQLERRRSKKRRKTRRKKKKHLQLMYDYPDFDNWKKKNSDVNTRSKGIEIEEEEYKELEKEYEDYGLRSVANNTAFKYSDEGKPEENFKEVIKKITDIKTPKNCTNVTGIGVQAVECLVKKFKNQEVSKKELLNKISIIVFAWFLIYLAVALPLWCAKGWCCCCFRCAFCFPYRTVKEIQKYISENPPGVYINAEGEEERYIATGTETLLYERLRRSIADF